MEISIEISEEEMIWLKSYLQARGLILSTGYDSPDRVDELLHRVYKAATPPPHPSEEEHPFSKAG